MRQIDIELYANELRTEYGLTAEQSKQIAEARIESEVQKSDDLVDELLNLIGDSVSEEEKEFLVTLTTLAEEYSKAIMDGDKVKQRLTATKYKKTYKSYQLQMVDKEELNALSAAERKEFEDQIEEEAEMTLQLTAMIANNEINDDELAEILGELLD